MKSELLVRIAFSLALLAGVLGYSPIAAGNLLENKAAEARDTETDIDSIYDAVHMFRSAFAAPISYENAKPWFERAQRVETTTRFSVAKGERLGDALDALVARTDGFMDWFNVGGHLLVAPIEGPATNMDSVISLSVEDVSPWEALKAFETAVNAERQPGRFVQVLPSCVGQGNRPPEGFVEGRMSLELTERPAREVLCALLEAAPLTMCYEFSMDEMHDVVRIVFIDEAGDRYCGIAMPEGEEMFEWDRKLFQPERDAPDAEIRPLRPEESSDDGDDDDGGG